MSYYMVLPFVVALITNRKGEILIGQDANSEKKPYPGFWNLPGGKLEEGESTEECIKRELKEELGVKVVSLKFIGTFHNSKKKAKVKCNNHVPGLGLCYKAVIKKGKIISTEQKNVHFASPRELRKLKMTPWAKFFIKKYI